MNFFIALAIVAALYIFSVLAIWILIKYAYRCKACGSIREEKCVYNEVQRTKDIGERIHIQTIAIFCKKCGAQKTKIVRTSRDWIS